MMVQSSSESHLITTSKRRTIIERKNMNRYLQADQLLKSQESSSFVTLVIEGRLLLFKTSTSHAFSFVKSYSYNYQFVLLFTIVVSTKESIEEVIISVVNCLRHMMFLVYLLSCLLLLPILQVSPKSEVESWMTVTWNARIPSLKWSNEC